VLVTEALCGGSQSPLVCCGAPEALRSHTGLSANTREKKIKIKYNKNFTKSLKMLFIGGAKELFPQQQKVPF
jgi:hypothetical protein